MKNRLAEEIFYKIAPNKRKHTDGVIKSARELAERFGANVENAELASLFHDITKHFDEKKQLELCEKYDIIYDRAMSYKLLHGYTAAEIARHEYGMNDEIYNAIKYHTTLRGDMTLIEKIVYLADYIEENRTFDGVETARELAKLDLDKALIYCLDTTIIEVIQRGGYLHQDTINARNHLVSLEV